MDNNLKIKYIREYFNLTQPEFAQKIGANKDKISNIERGITKEDISLLQRISEKFGIDPNYFFEKVNLNSLP